MRIGGSAMPACTHPLPPGEGRVRGSLLGLLAALLFACPSSAGPGLWLLPRHDLGNTGRADIAGNMAVAPRVVWAYGYDPQAWSDLRMISLQGQRAYLAQLRAGIMVLRPNGDRVWSRPTMGVRSILYVFPWSPPAALVTLGEHGLALLDLATGRTRWQWSPPRGSEVHLRGLKVVPRGPGAWVVVMPSGPRSTWGFCFEMLPGKQVRQVWRADYAGKYWPNFGPVIAVADMDNAGLPEVVLASKPAYVAVIDLATGRIRYDLKYPVTGADEEGIGRPYGLLQVADLDGDGYQDVLMASTQVEEYVGVLHNAKGKGLTLAWSHFVGHSYPNPTRSLRAPVGSVADVNGDGRPELVFSLFNDTGDQRWHVVLLDPQAGWEKPLADLPNRVAWGTRDLDGDDRPEIITTTPAGRETPLPAPLQAVDGRTLADLAVLDLATPVLTTSPMPLHVAQGGNSVSPLTVRLPAGSGILVAQGGMEVVWRIAGGRAACEPFAAGPLARTMLLSQGGGAMPLVPRFPPVKPGLSAFAPLVAQDHGRRELILSRSDGTVIGGQPDWAHPGRFLASWTIPGAMPSVCMVPAGDGAPALQGRRVVWVADGPAALACYEPLPGGSQPSPLSRFPLPLPLAMAGMPRTTGVLYPYVQGDEMRVFVGHNPGRYPMACGVYGRESTIIWLDRENGPNPRAGAVGDLNGDGRMEAVVDYNGRHLFYDAAGHGRLVAHGWNNTIPGRGDGAKYALPIIGPFGPAREMRVVMSPGLDALETLGPSGERLAKADYDSSYQFDWATAAVARLRPQRWDVGMVDVDGIFHCADTATCATRWTLSLGVRATSPITVSAGDLDGDGQDNFLVALPDGRLVALDEHAGKGAVLWTVTFGAGVKEAIIADVDGDGLAEIVVDLDNGYVKVLKGGRL